MASSSGNLITFSSHNINGWNHSKDFLFSLCDRFPHSIRGIQEHWLGPPYKKHLGVNRLRTLHPDFDGFGTSGMKKTNEQKIRTGRPFGGTGFLFDKKFSECINPLLNYNHERVTAIKITTEEGDVIVVNAYLPFYNTRDLENQTIAYQETVSYIDHILSSNPSASFILLMDMNCNLYNSSHPFSKFIIDLMMKHSLFSALDLMPGFDSTTFYTRCEPKTNSFTLIDGILVSKSLRNRVVDVRIPKYGDNVSDHLPVELDLNLSVKETVITQKKIFPTVNWQKLSEEDKDLFQKKMTERLNQIYIPFHLLIHGDKSCSNHDHRAAIETYYNQVVEAVLYADGFLPRSTPAIYKPYWSSTLSELKQKSITCCNVWKLNGSPRSGPLFMCKQDCTYTYKRAIRAAKSQFDKKRADDLHDYLTTRDYDSFWSVWRNKYREPDSLVPRINGETTEHGIAHAFCEHFQKVYSNNKTPAHLTLKREFEETFSSYQNEHENDSLGPFFFSWSEMVDVVAKIKLGKSSSGFIKPEHIFHGSDKLLLHLHLLFNSMVQHGFVVDDFLRGTITPIVKDSEGDLSSCSNFRGITIGSLFSKLFELAVDAKISHLLYSDPLQFGFKKRTSTEHALFVLTNTVDHFTSKNSCTFVAFLDCSKAFDRISHYGLFSKLMERNIPLCFLFILMHWHLNMSCRVKWGSSFSDEFVVPLGTKQGGVISPKFFSLYVDDMISYLRKKGIGCHIIDIFVACIMFADDLALIAPSRSALQKMIDLCIEYCDKFCLDFNSKKSKVMTFGKGSSEIEPLFIKDIPIDFVHEWKYLGTTIKAGTNLGFSARPDVTNFFRASNAVLNTLGEAHEHTQLQLVYSNCLPIMTYAASVKQFSSDDLLYCNKALNDVLRKIFGFRDWRSIRELRDGFGFQSVTDIFRKRQRRFQQNCHSHINPIVRTLIKLE